MLIAKVSEIKRRRNSLGISMCALSEKAGLPNNAIYRIENMKFNKTHPIRARAIAKALKCKVSDIFEEV